MRAPVLFVGVLLITVAGCGSSDDDDPGDGTSAGGGMPVGEVGYKRCAPAGIGEFTIDVKDTGTNIGGTVTDRVFPLKVAEQTKTSGECRLMKARNLICNPACGEGKTCDVGGKCVAYPQQKSVGTVTFEGLAAPVSIKPTETNNYFFTGTLPDPALPVGAEVRMNASGGDYQPFTLKAVGVAPLVAPPVQPAELASGKPARIMWTAAPQPSTARVHLRLDVNHHGTTSNWIECDVADTGSYEIPATLMTDLIGFGLSGYPTIVISRRSSDAMSIRPGCVELRVAAGDEFDVKVAGLTSCKDNMDCPAGKMCGPDQACK